MLFEVFVVIVVATQIKKHMLIEHNLIKLNKLFIKYAVSVIRVKS